MPPMDGPVALPEWMCCCTSMVELISAGYMDTAIHHDHADASQKVQVVAGALNIDHTTLNGAATVGLGLCSVHTANMDLKAAATHYRLLMTAVNGSCCDHYRYYGACALALTSASQIKYGTK